MFNGRKVIAVTPIKNSRNLKYVLPCLEAQRHIIDGCVMVFDSPVDTYLRGLLTFYHCQYPGWIKIENTRKSNEGDSSPRVLIPNILALIDKDAIIVYFDENICYVEPNGIKNLLCAWEEHPKQITHAAAINTTRTLYIHQVMGLLPDILLREWSFSYIDDIDLAMYDPMFAHTIHETFLSSIECGELHRWKFDRYLVPERENVIGRCFIFDAKTDISKTSIIYGGCIVSQWAYAQQQEAMNNREDLRERYTKSASVPQSSSISVPGPITGTKDIQIVISTHKSIEARSLPVLLPSLYQDNKIPRQNILVVSGGYNQNKMFTKPDGIRYSRVCHNSFDHTGLIDIIDKNIPGEWWFAMHDTCKVGPRFYDKLQTFGIGTHHASILPEGWLNMGLFSREYINKSQNYILSLRNSGKMRAILSEKMYTRMIKSAFYEMDGLRAEGTKDIYNDGVARHIIYFPSLDLLKFQSFFHNSEAMNALAKEHIRPYPSENT